MNLRQLWAQIHLWIGLTLGVVGVLIGITGSILVYETQVDAAISPQRYAVSGSDVALPYSAYIEGATQVLDSRIRATLVRFPQKAGLPVVVFARARGENGGVMRVYLDPPTGRVLDVSPGGGFVGWAHQFHEHLTLREYGGREIVGAVGIAMLISSLSGLYLWWPTCSRLREALLFRRGIALTRNLHYFFGFYFALVLAMLSFTGIFLAYPDAGRNVVAAFGPVSPSMRNVNADTPSRGKAIAPDQAAQIAKERFPNAQIVVIGLPQGARGAYRVGMNDSRDASIQPGGNTVVFVDPASGAVLRSADASVRSSGDTFLALQRSLHSGASLGVIGRVVICIVGFAPALFVITGLTMWLQRRRQRKVYRTLQPETA
jgi:uncharacterized iron-regulated membrane protein